MKWEKLITEKNKITYYTLKLSDDLTVYYRPCCGGTMGRFIDDYMYIEFDNRVYSYKAPNSKKITKEDLKKVFEIIKPAIEDFLEGRESGAKYTLEEMAKAKENLEVFSKKMKK